MLQNSAQELGTFQQLGDTSEFALHFGSVLLLNSKPDLD